MCGKPSPDAGLQTKQARQNSIRNQFRTEVGCKTVPEEIFVIFVSLIGNFAITFMASKKRFIVAVPFMQIQRHSRDITGTYGPWCWQGRWDARNVFLYDCGVRLLPGPPPPHG